MSTGNTTLYVVLGVAVAVAAIVVGSYVSAYNFGNRSEQSIVAIYEDNENVLAQYGQKVQEAAGMTELLRDDLIAVFTGANEARYGATGSDAVFQWIQEQNPQLDSSAYLQVQRLIEAGRNEFQSVQTRLVDGKRSYRTGLGSFWRGTWLSVAGYPRISVGYPVGTRDDYPVISTSRARGAFEAGVEEGPVQLRRN